MSDPASALAFLDLPGGRTVVGHGPFTTATAPPAQGAAFYRNDFGLRSAAPWWIPARYEVLSRGELPARLGTDTRPDCEWSLPEASSFAAVFQEISAAIRGGAFEKTVPVVVERGLLSSPPGLSFVHAAASCPEPHSAYGFIDGDRGFAGTSPECLLSISGSLLRTMALAGTARIEEKDVLAADEKEIREHEYVAQTLVAKLGDLGTVRRGPRGLMELGSIVHFHTPIEVDLSNGPSIDSLVRRLHPTPALGPLPRTPDTMEQLVSWRRRLGTPEDFGAPFGAFLDGGFHALVMIRGLWWQDRELLLPAGCGVIEASRLVNEWRELRLKREAVKARFGL
jgi:menaquinone-specific isochorismate synthase